MPAEPIGNDELAGWLRLVETPDVGPATCRALLATFGLPDAVFGASRDQLLRVVPPAIAAAIQRAPTDALVATIEKTQAWVAEPDNHVVTFADERYPANLLQISDPPPLLYVKGRVELLGSDSIAIVGSRNATAQGLIDARRFAEALAAGGLTVVSGLALGIDAAAHEGALAAGAAGGSTIAVIGTGADIVYPASHRSLAHRIAEQGVIVGEFPLGVGASAHGFPRRNRIIAGLARGVLVVEAAARSGSLITARLAAEAGRDVFAIPGSIHSPLSKGCHQLIRQGAKLVESVADILDEWPAGARMAPSLEAKAKPAADETILLDRLGFAPISVDELSRRSGIGIADLAAILLDLELSGRIARLPGGRVQRLVDPGAADHQT